MAFDTTRLVDQITVKGCLPTGRFEDQEILDIAYDVMLSEIVPLVISVREEYFGRKTDSSLVANQAEYDIDSRALAGVLREVKFIAADGTPTDLERTDLEDINSVTTGTPDSFYLQGDSVVLVPTPSAASGSLRQFYFIRPSKFVTVASCGAITAIDGARTTITVTIPTGWSTSNTFDIVRGRAHYGILSRDLAASSVAGGAITFTTALPSTAIVGDYVTLAEETCFPPIPPEGHMYLIQSSAAAALESIGDPKAAEVATKAAMLKENFKSLLAIRVQGAPKRLAARVL